MLLKYFYDDHLAQASYLVGCAANGEALVIDPSRTITPYLEVAEAHGLRITQVTETHIHADYVSGSRELAIQTGARLFLSAMGDADWQYQYTTPDTVLVRDGDSWMIGSIKVEVLHTPGHTPEHIVFLITDTAGANKPIGLFTGDFIFVGTVGRPDLLEEAAGLVGTREIGARQQFRSVQQFRTLPDYLQIWPGHGAGSACGKALGALPSTTLGYEKLFNPAFQFDDEAEFVKWLLDGQPEAPRYFAQMKKVNKTGPTLLADVTPLQHLPATALSAILDSDALVIDTRTGNEYCQGFIPGTLHVPSTSKSFSTYAGWFVDYDRPVYLIAHDHLLERLVGRLRAIGVDNLPGYFTPEVLQQATDTLPQLTPQEVEQGLHRGEFQVIDVRGINEYLEGHIAHAVHIPLGYLSRHLATLDPRQSLVLQCETGVRSLIAASYLRQNGFTKVYNLAGGIEAWRGAGLSVRYPLAIESSS